MIVQVTRGGLVESQHTVAAYACEAGGNTLFQSGNVDAPVYVRSSSKPFIAATVIAAGARERFGLDEREIAVMAASHSGEAIHVEAVRSLLHKIGLSESALRCGAHLPYNDLAARAMLARGESPSAVHNNCSGKHAGILALCTILGAPTQTYLDANHPAQRAILEFCARLCDDDARTWPVAVDGCGIPVYATPLRKIALSFARLATLRGIGEREARALEIVRGAMIAQPEYVAGAGEFDTELMRAGEGTIVSKGGAEGMHGVAIVPHGAGYASKVLDGAARARAPSSIAALERLGALSAAQVDRLTTFARPVVYNRAGTSVGEIRVVV